MPEPILEDRDYTVIVGKTAPSVTITPPGFGDRWNAAHDAIIALTQRCEALDPDGITIYISSKDYPQGAFKPYRQVNSEQLGQIFNENYPPEALNLLEGLQAALDDYFARKAGNQTKPNGEIIVVLIDGEPSDRMAIVKTIVDATQKMDSDQELGIGFAQIGDDIIARGFLESLDENLRQSAGAQFDIVTTRPLEEIQPHTLTDFLLDVIRD